MNLNRKTNYENSKAVVSYVTFGEMTMVFLLRACLIFGVMMWVFIRPAFAQISDVTVSDVTIRAFSIIWVSDEPVESATLHVYSDEQGTNEVTDDLSIALVSPAAALDRGIVKIDVTGALANTQYFVSGDMTDKSGVVSTLPQVDEPLISVQLAKEATRIDENGEPIANDLLMQTVLGLDGLTPAVDELILVSVPQKSQYPISAFSTQDETGAKILLDLNNLFAKSTSKSLKVPNGSPVQIAHFRGISCPSEQQKIKKLRRLPVKVELSPVAEVEVPQSCFSPENKAVDFNCDGNIAFGDFNIFLSEFGISNLADTPNCGFNEDFDLNQDKTIDFGDFNLFLSVFGKSEAIDSGQ